MTLARALALVGLQTLLLAAGGLAARAVAAAQGLDPEQLLSAPSPAVLAVIVAVGLTGVVGLVWWGSVRAPGRTFADLGWRLDRLPRHVAVGLAAGAACLALELGALAAVGVAPREALAAMAAFTPGERAVFALVGLQAAFVEESLFRGNLLDALRTRLPTLAAVAVSAVIFSAYHPTPSPLGLGVKAGFGLVYAAARLGSGSLVAPAIAHAIVWIVAGTI